MSTVPITRRKVKEILRLTDGCSLSHRQLAKRLSMSPSVVSHYANRACQRGITDWPLTDKWDEVSLHHAFTSNQGQDYNRFPPRLVCHPSGSET